MENHRYVKSAKKRKKIAYDVPLGKIKNDKQRNTFINQKETLRIQTQRFPRKNERTRIS